MNKNRIDQFFGDDVNNIEQIIGSYSCTACEKQCGNCEGCNCRCDYCNYQRQNEYNIKDKYDTYEINQANDHKDLYSHLNDNVKKQSAYKDFVEVNEDVHQSNFDDDILSIYDDSVIPSVYSSKIQEDQVINNIIDELNCVINKIDKITDDVVEVPLKKVEKVVPSLAIAKIATNPVNKSSVIVKNNLSTIIKKSEVKKSITNVNMPNTTVQTKLSSVNNPKTYKITYGLKNKHKLRDYITDNYAVYVNGECGATMHLHKGRKYCFDVTCDVKDSFYNECGGIVFTDIQGPNSKKVFPTLPTKNGKIYFEINEDIPSLFYYGDINSPYSGGLIMENKVKK